MKALKAISAALAFLVIVNFVVAPDPPDPTGTCYARGPESPLEDATYDHGVVSFKHMYVGRGNDHPGFIGAAIGACRLEQEFPDGKKIETALPASSIVVFDEKGKVKKALP